MTLAPAVVVKSLRSAVYIEESLTIQVDVSKQPDLLILHPAPFFTMRLSRTDHSAPMECPA